MLAVNLTPKGLSNFSGNKVCFSMEIDINRSKTIKNFEDVGSGWKEIELNYFWSTGE